MQKNFIYTFLCVISYLFVVGCNSEKTNYRFSYVNASKSKINFNNHIVETDSVNVISFQYVYNGGGVGIGDFNNDGLSDIVFTGNQVSSKIYLNQGDFKFKDISNSANFNTKGWVTGVVIVDINGDGWDDIYLSVGGSNCNNDCENLLFINKGLKNGEDIPVFEEQAKPYNLNDGHYSQQAVFFDYDLDGDLDVYIAHNGNVKFDKNSPVPKHYMPKNLADFLLRNDTKKGMDHPVFTNVSDSLGITHKGFSLGLNLQDFNNDNLPDIYVSNDFITEDLLYLNNGIDPKTKIHKGFTESNKKLFSHLTYNAMGVDVADINNDTYPDIMVLDMLPENYERQKRMLGTMNYDKYLLSKHNDYSSQYMHNTLQLHNGMLKDSILKASEVGFISGMSSTDWSWAPLIADFDNDGDKDTFITNGYVKDLTDLDFINYSTQNTMFGSKDSRDRQLQSLLKNVSGVNIPNYFYENTGSIKFRDVSSIWKVPKNSFSNGAAYADLDNDGDLDIAVNNINHNAFIIENNTTALNNENYLRVKLKGSKANTKAIGSKVSIWQNGTAQHQYQSVVRGYLSSMEPVIHFGLAATKIDSIVVIWPDGNNTTLKDVKANTLLNIDQKLGKIKQSHLKTNETLLQDVSHLLDYRHKENIGHDYVSQHLLMRQYSKFGPCVATANIDGNFGDEVFIGGSKGEPGTIWFEDENGIFQIKQQLDADFEDVDAVFLDIDNDSDLDLYVGSGGTEFKANSLSLQDRIYINDGEGYLTLAKNLLPEHKEVTSIIRPHDFDKDGDIDIFTGSRISTGNYPKTPNSQLLINDSGVLKKVNNESLQKLGMITDAIWQDINNDNWDDLIILGEWMPITIFINNKGKFEKFNANFENENGESVMTYGWWNTIAAGDFDKDGDIDFIAGNQGENGFVSPKPNKPVYVYTEDFDHNGSIDPVIGQYFNDPSNNSMILPVQTRDDITKQLVGLKSKYLTYEAFSKVGFKELLNIENLETHTLKATTFTSSYIENLGNGNFKIIALPELCQVAPINDILIKDIDDDGYLDALLVGNDFSSESNYGLSDALIGLYLKGDDNGFKVLNTTLSGFYVPKQSHHITSLQSKFGYDLIIATQNNASTKVYRTKK